MDLQVKAERELDEMEQRLKKEQEESSIRQMLSQNDTDGALAMMMSEYEQEIQRLNRKLNEVYHNSEPDPYLRLF